MRPKARKVPFVGPCVTARSAQDNRSPVTLIDIVTLFLGIRVYD